MDKELLNNISIVSDLLAGDMDLYQQRLKNIDFTKIRLALDFLINNEDLSAYQKTTLITNSWRVYYRAKPPTPEEFMTEKYLGSMAESLYPRLKKWFVEFMDEKSSYRNAVLYPFFGAGKSTLAVLINLYITIHLAMMRNPKKYFGLAPSANLAFVLCSYNLTKAQETLLEPFINILNNSDFFVKVRTHEDMIKREKDYQREKDISHLYWTTASRNGVSALQFSNSLNYKMASSPSAILGLAQPLDEKVKKADGTYTTMGLLKVGDKIASPSEGETTILGVYPQGCIPCYRITLEDGRKVRCSLQHLWKVTYKTQEGGALITDVVSLQFILDHPDWNFFVYDKEDCTIPEVPNQSFVRNCL